MDEFIPISKLKEGFGIATRHIQNMIDSSKILFDSKHYTTSISLSILTLEELTKFRVILIHFHNKIPITKEEWISLSKGGSHATKLKKIYEDAMKQVIEMGEKHHKKVQELGKKLGQNKLSDFQKITKDNPYVQKLPNLNNIKKDCIYLNWENTDWSTFDTKFTPEGQEIMAEVLFYQNLLLFLEIVLEYRHHTVSLNEKSPRFQEYQNDPIRLKIMEIEKTTTAKEFQEKVAVAQKIMVDYS